MKRLKYIKGMALFIVFICLLYIGICYTTWVVRDKSLGNIWVKLREQKRDSIDVIFLGTSHQFCSIDVDLLYEEYGINGFMLATSGQTMPMTYYAAKEAIRMQHPSVIVFEALYCHHDFRTLTDGMTHSFFDGMPYGAVKKEAVEDLIEDESQRIYYYLDLGYFHNRWKDLKEPDFHCTMNSSRGNYHFEETNPGSVVPVLETDEKREIPEGTLYYLDLLIKLCQENNIRLIMYVAPFGVLNEGDDPASVYEMQKSFHWIQDYVEPMGIPFYNLFEHVEELNLDYGADYMDAQHFNFRGQEKFTRFMVENGYFDF